MASLRDRFNQFSGKTRFVVCRVFVHLAGKEAAPFLGILNRAASQAVAAEGDLTVLGEGLVEICQGLLQYQTFWQSAANEGDVVWDEGEAGDYVNELFTDSAQRYMSGVELDDSGTDDADLSLPVSQNVIVMLTIAAEGDVPSLETDLADIKALETGLKDIINLYYSDRLRAIQVHFSPSRLGDELTSDQLLEFFPELIPL
ncbi:DUF1517 domain-containing protein [Myxacorys almedinensis]|uniref:DUF1517 domain-containing protein n=1 Tax=Myxacorys almedinensis A TaxID=2690445 RepID=A0A8J7Z3X8_9CYAN|nr:DUF1517 domain-containing protein [Myxacorys almedinensis]NDJ17411.1 DUF1517 domain-containing protein [Myxacorys almedinensis A]